MPNCEICRKEPSPDCDYNQGRCPHRQPLIKIQPKDTSKGHFYVSIVKSIVRILAGASLVFAGYNSTTWFTVAGMLLIVAEFLGVLEEVV